MDLKPAYLFGKVMHARLFPGRNRFCYRMFQLAVPLDRLTDLNQGWRLGVNRFALMSFYEQDHGPRTGAPLQPWINTILDTHGLGHLKRSVVLLSMPRLLGYVFNPVSFWLCYDPSRQLQAVLVEVNNTFGETHSYLCVLANHAPITSTTWIVANKVFHVSPFLPRTGQYRFRFQINPNTLTIEINYYDAQDQPQLVTRLSGALAPLTRRNWYRAFMGYPLLNLTVIFRIHWQALRLLIKRQRFFKKPKPTDAPLSVSQPQSGTPS